MGQGLGWLVGLCLFCVCVFGQDDRPKLKKATFSERSDSFLGSTYEWVESSFEFDQELYLNEPFVCVNAELDPPELDCVPCDWSRPGADTCWDSNCCQPQISSIANPEVWCSDSELYPFTPLNIDERTETFKLDADETRYFRFFLGEEVYWRPVMVAVRSIYGNHQFFMSSVHPEPTYDLAYTEPYSVFYRQNQWSFAQSVTNVCPGTTIYTPGTYSIGIDAFEATEFYFEIIPSPIAFPLPEPEEKVPCDSVPDEVYEVTYNNGRGVRCLEDGVTTVIDSATESDLWGDDMFDLILPIPAGCHGVAIGIQNLNSTFVDHDMNCLRLHDDLPIKYWGDYNTAQASWKTTDDTLSFFGCFPEITYVHCAVLPWEYGRAGIIFSTVSPFHRSPIKSIPPSVLSSQIGIGALGVNRPDALACGDFHLWCSSWAVSALSSDPLVFWPAPAIASILPVHYDPLPTEIVPGEALGDTIVFVDTTIRAGTRYGWRESQLVDSTLYFLLFTNEDGLPVEIPHDGPLHDGNHSLFEYIPSIRYQEMESRKKDCDSEKFHAHQRLVDDLITSVEDSSLELDPVALPYYVEVFNAREVYGDCLSSIINVFPTDNRTIIRSGVTCLFSADDPEWELDPCCNVELEATQCCRFKSGPFETSLRSYERQNEVVCRANLACSESYFVDFVRSYNDQFDGIIGCPTQTPLEKKRYSDTLKQKEFEKIRFCLSLAGYGGVDGAHFMGTPCSDDIDCAHGCDQEKGICVVEATSNMEIEFLQCWIEQMGTFVEDYIRRRVFTSKESHSSRFNRNFLFFLQDHATTLDCVSPTHPLDFSQRAHTTLIDTDLRVNGEEVTPVCPGGDLCLFDHTPEGSSVFVPDDFSRLGAFVTSTSESCRIAGECEGCLEEGVCVSCVDANNQESCVVREGVDREECETSGVCIHPNGELEYGLTEEECNSIQGQCSLCLVDYCTTWKIEDSADPLEGVCIYSGVTEADCPGAGGSWDDESSTCHADAALQSSSDCQGAGHTWETCGNYEMLDECTSGSPLMSYLGCQWTSALSSQCTSQELCESGGRCSDSHLLFPIEGGTRGGCSFPGVVVDPGTPPNLLDNENSYKNAPVGYMRKAVVDESTCHETEGKNVWLNEALTEEECVGSPGRRGCFLPAMRFTLAFFYEEEDCECLGGKFRSATRWETGKWKESKFVPFQWNEEPQSPKYEWVDTLSIRTLVGWTVDSVEERATAITVSSLTCERNFTSSSLDWIVCNCLSEDSTNECLVSSAPRVAAGRVCNGLSTNLSAPSSRLMFTESSISRGCVSVNLGFLSVDGFTYLRKRPSITVQFEEPQTTGLVVNDKGATVGSLLGDGIEISFAFEPYHEEKLEAIEYFDVCLNQHENRGQNFEKSGEVADFALYDDEGTLKILYMDLDKVDISGYTYWCGRIEHVETLAREGRGDGDSFTLFPVSRMKEAEDQNIHSDRAEILAYILTGFFLALMVFYLCLLINNLVTFHTLLGVAVPVLFLMLCVFRAVFFLLWTEGKFDDDAIAEYLVFETPTFLLLTLLLVLIACWKSISQKKNRNDQVSYTREIVLSICVVLLYISIVIASVVMSETIEEEESDCPGRAPSDNSELEDALNTLSIVYMSVVTFFTFVLTGVLFFEARGIVRMVSKGFIMAIVYVPTSRFTFVFLFFFLLRCILFLILYAIDISSDIFIFCILMICEIIPCMALWVEVFIVAFSHTTKQEGSTRNISASNTSTSTMHSRRLSKRPTFSGRATSSNPSSPSGSLPSGEIF